MTMDPRSASTAKKKAPGIFLSSFCVIIYVRIVTDNEISSGSIQLSYSTIMMETISTVCFFFPVFLLIYSSPHPASYCYEGSPHLHR